MADMNGQVALVTGGTRGIGLAICERLMNRGVKVAAGYAEGHDNAQQFADKYADRGVTIHQGNIGNHDDVARVIDEVLSQHGHLDILVNNAGITVDKTVRKMSWQEWDHVIHVNLSGAFYLSQGILQTMLDRGYGRIIYISSVIGSAGGFGQANYASAKSGLFGLTMSLALETASQGHHGQRGHARVHHHRHDRGGARQRDGEARRAHPGGPARRGQRGRPGGGVPRRP